MPRMPRLPRRPAAPRPHGVSGAFAATLARRRDARAERIVVRDRTGVSRTVDAEDDPAGKALVKAAEDLIFAAQRGSAV